MGPLFFIIMMLDIDAGLSKCKLGSFADDTKVWYLIKSLYDQAQLQQELNTLYKWSDDNNFDFNEKKFEHLSYGRSDLETSYHTPNANPIKKNDPVRDLGVHFSPTGTFSEHIKIIVAEAKKISGYILRTFRTRERGPMLTLLKSLVVSKLEYACVLWSPTDKRSIRILENVQRRFTSKIGGFYTDEEGNGRLKCQKDYWERLKDLKIYSLQRRRERYMILYLYKVIIGLCPNPGFERILFNDRTGFKVESKRAKTAAAWVQKLRNSSFFSQGPTIFNMLPIDLRNFSIPEHPSKTDVDKYKEKLDKYLRNIPDQPDIPNAKNMRAAETNSLVHQIHYWTQPSQSSQTSQPFQPSNSATTTNDSSCNTSHRNNQSSLN